MKKFKYLLLLIPAVMLLPAFVVYNSLPPAESVAIVTKTVNDVKYKSGGSGWSDLKNGSALQNSDEIKTGDKSLALVKFTDNSVLRVRDNSMVKIFAEKTGKNVSKTTEINSGTVGFNVTKQDQNDFKFNTPTLVASIRGTGGLVQGGDDQGLVAIEEGSVFVEAIYGNRQTGMVPAGTFVYITKEGDVTVLPFNNTIQNLINNSKKTNVKKLIIKTDSGDLIIEYFVD